MTDYIGILDGEDTVWGCASPTSRVATVAGPQRTRRLPTPSAAREWAEQRHGAGGSLPQPRSLSEINIAEAIGASAGEIAVIVPVLLDLGRTVRANVTFGAGLLATIDAEAGRRGLTRSAFLASAAKERIGARR